MTINLSGSENPECKCVLDCKEGWEEQGDYCFQWSSVSDTWSGAESSCRREGATLASITSSAIDEYVLKEMEGRTIPILWIGGSDREVEDPHGDDEPDVDLCRGQRRARHQD